MKRVMMAVLAASSFLALGGCYGGIYHDGGGTYVDSGYIGEGPTYAYGGPDEYYDGYYDGFYGPFYDGYWGDDGFFYYSDRDHHHWRRDDGHHYWHGHGGNPPSTSFRHIHGSGAPRMMGAHGPAGDGHMGGGAHHPER